MTKLLKILCIVLALVCTRMIYPFSTRLLVWYEISLIVQSFFYRTRFVRCLYSTEMPQIIWLQRCTKYCITLYKFICFVCLFIFRLFVSFQGGLGTDQEMCLSFLTYYPKLNLTRCWSSYKPAIKKFQKAYVEWVCDIFSVVFPHVGDSLSGSIFCVLYAVFGRISVRFCGFRTPLTPPSFIDVVSVKLWLICLFRLTVESWTWN